MGLAPLPSESGCIRDAEIMDSCISISVMHGQSYYRPKRYAIYGAETTALLSRHIKRPAIFNFKIIIEDKDLGPFAYSEGFERQSAQ
jgi:hypothetical protein